MEYTALMYLFNPRGEFEPLFFKRAPPLLTPSRHIACSSLFLSYRPYIVIFLKRLGELFLDKLHHLVGNSYVAPGGSVFGGPLAGRSWRVIRGFPGGIRGWPAAPSLGGPIMDTHIKS